MGTSISADYWAAALAGQPAQLAQSNWEIRGLSCILNEVLLSACRVKDDDES